MKLGWLVLVAGCAAEISPLSLEAHYLADSPRLAQAETLSGLHIAVARFSDARARAGNDLHAASYVAEDRAYHLGLTWNGRTFAPAALVAQALLVSELQHAGVVAVALDAEVAADDLPGAQALADRAGCDLVLGGTLRKFSGAAEGVLELEVAVFGLSQGKVLLRAPFSEAHPLPADLSSQRRVEELLDRAFRPVAHQIVNAVGDELARLAEARRSEVAVTPEPQPEAEPSPAPVVEPPHPHHKVRRR